jgi:hypothetical protein
MLFALSYYCLFNCGGGDSLPRPLKQRRTRGQQPVEATPVLFLFAGTSSATAMRLDTATLGKDTASGHRRGATRTWGTSDDGVGIAVSSTSASVCPQSVACSSYKHTADSPTVMEGQR